MQFLYPFFLWALLSLAIPVLIHLFYFRRFKRVYFTNVRFLKEIKEETSNRNRLKNLLVLLTRLLALTCLVLAFAQPFIPTDANVKSGIRSVSVFVDNSFSMTSQIDEIPLLDIAKEKARNIINAYNEDDKFQILTHDFEGRHQRFLSKEDALAYIDEIQSTPAVQTMSNIFNRQLQLFKTANAAKISYIISDFQKSITDFASYSDTTAEINLLPVQASVSKNIYVDSVWFDSPIPMANQNNKLIIRVRNGSSELAEEVKLSIKKDGQDKPVGILDIPGGGSVTDTFVLKEAKTGWQEAEVLITDYPIQFDDNYHIAYFVPDTIRVLQIFDKSPNRYLGSAIRGLPNFIIQQQAVSQLQYQTLRNYNLIVLDDVSAVSTGLSGELVQYLRDGGKVLLFPGFGANLASLNTFLSACNAGNLRQAENIRKEVALINTESFIFSEVYLPARQNMTLPVTTVSYQIATNSVISQENLLTYRDGAPCLAGYKVNDGQLFVFSAPLDQEYNNLSTSAEVFVPMLYKMAVASTRVAPLAYYISNKLLLETQKLTIAGDFVYKVTNGTDEFLPTLIPSGNRTLLDLGGQVRKAGAYNIVLDEVIGKAAFNYNRKESELSFYTEGELGSIHPLNKSIRVLPVASQANILTTISEKDRGIVLWKYFILGALFFLALEIVLVRYLKS